MQLQDRFYKSTEVADILGVSLRTLYRYMDSQKIDSVQLPSGRHRFTKKQIEDFLYSNNLSPSTATSIPNYAPTAESFSVPQAPQASPLPSYGTNFRPNTVQTPQQPITTQTVPTNNDIPSERAFNEEDEQKLEAELDELLKSLDEDVVSPNEPSQPVTPVAPIAVDVQRAVEATSNIELNENQTKVAVDRPNAFSISDQTQEQEVPKASINENEVHFYYCPYTDLRHIAKLVQRTAQDEKIDYAFTMNAGLSLFFPLEPFSLIHLYIRPEDKDVWAKELQLREASAADDANIGLLLSTGRAFDSTKEVSGLCVVNKSILIENLKANGENSLATQAESKLE